MERSWDIKEDATTKEKMIQIAIKEYKHKSKKVRSFDSNILEGFNGSKGCKGLKGLKN